MFLTSMRNAELSLQLLQLLAHGRLGYVQPAGRPAEVELLGDDRERFKLAQFHSVP